ncbi:Histidine phosphatase superfamily, clade-1 [Corchorus olitorius]|uniref:Histidine phosphatase superfamily, clade-1 n=1 Tax=Corchorus olitorius TaxID=93759 RepID=A0A1R3L4T5_9ROSI|nr:Histidine phosphatase superfamily, clade-1 [Corchorus olitorius]
MGSIKQVIGHLAGLLVPELSSDKYIYTSMGSSHQALSWTFSPHALANMHFDKCFASPISRAKTTAEVLWQGREEPLVFLDSLKEAHLFFLEGMKNVDARVIYPKEYVTWREDPANFYVNGVYPTRRLWATAREAWREILLTPVSSLVLALICTALGLPPERFRAIDVNNGSISTISFNKRGEAMLQSLNMTAHMYNDHVYLS